jgi:hypothetical protein
MATTKDFPSGFKTLDRLKMKMGANFKALKGCIAAIALSGTNKGLVVEGTAAGNLLIIGRFGETVDNTGGAAGAKKVEVLFHRHFECLKLVNDATTPVAETDIGQRCFVKDNNTVSMDGSGRSVGGTVWGFDDALVLVEPGLNVACGVTRAIPIPIASFVDADGDPLAKFVDGASTVPGFNLANSKAFGLRWNNHATPDEVLTSVPLPSDRDPTQALVLKVIASKSGATLGDAVTFTFAAYFNTVGELHDADANAGGASTAMTGNAAAKTVQLVSRTIAAADVPAGAAALTLTMQPTDGLLGTDDVIVEGVFLEYVPKAA